MRSFLSASQFLRAFPLCQWGSTAHSLPILTGAHSGRCFGSMLPSARCQISVMQSITYYFYLSVNYWIGWRKYWQENLHQIAGLKWEREKIDLFVAVDGSVEINWLVWAGSADMNVNTLVESINTYRVVSKKNIFHFFFRKSRFCLRDTRSLRPPFLEWLRQKAKLPHLQWSKSTSYYWDGSRLPRKPLFGAPHDRWTNIFLQKCWPSEVLTQNDTVIRDRYRAMITEFFILQLNDHSTLLWERCGFNMTAQNGTAHASIEFLNETFKERILSRDAPVHWPPRSCDFTSLDYFL